MSRWMLMLLLIASAPLLLAGCQTASPPTTPNEAQATPTASPTDSPYSRQAQQAARALAQRFAAMGDPSEPPPEILWLDQKVERDRQGRQGPATLTPRTLVATPAVEIAPAAPPQRDTSGLAKPAPAKSTAITSRADLLKQLLADLRQTHGPSDLKLGLLAAQLSLLEPGQALDPSLLTGLTDAQQQRVERYQALLVSLHTQLADGSRHVDRRTLLAQMDALLADQPVEIVTFKLCRRVRGFGIYEAFDSKVFLAGHDQKMIAYLELDHFRPQRNEQGLYEVRLTQEMELYDAEGLLVWQHEPVSILDTSANLRRDFFTVQMLTLPARLTVGTFHLKARVTDEQTGNRSEVSSTLEIVADPSLVQRAKPAAAAMPAPRSLVP